MRPPHRAAGGAEDRDPQPRTPSDAWRSPLSTSTTTTASSRSSAASATSSGPSTPSWSTPASARAPPGDRPLPRQPRDRADELPRRAGPDRGGGGDLPRAGRRPAGDGLVGLRDAGHEGGDDDVRRDEGRGRPPRRGAARRPARDPDHRDRALPGLHRVGDELAQRVEDAADGHHRGRGPLDGERHREEARLRPGPRLALGAAGSGAQARPGADRPPPRPSRRRSPRGRAPRSAAPPRCAPARRDSCRARCPRRSPVRW